MQRVLIGCSGWNYADWRGPFYPERGCPASRWLEFYARHFPTVEINSTFYRLASRDAVARWLTQTPEDFVFAPKISRYITHIKRLSSTQAVQRFYEHIEPLVKSRKFGPVLWQLPENFHRDDDRLHAGQPLDVRDVAADLRCKHEVLRGLREPARHRVAAGQPVEGRVDLDRGEVARVELEPAVCRAAALGIERPAPFGVVPARAADQDPLH